MRQIFISFVFSLFITTIQAQKTGSIAVPDSTKKILQVEASCGQCQFGLTGKGCNLAVRINGKAYFVDGTSIDDHGDAHAKDGFCEAIRKADVQGEVINDRFKATYFRLVKDQPKQPAKEVKEKPAKTGSGR